MSLILTSNTAQNDSYSALNTGINRPYDYRNFMTDTFEIEADSEVAVQSVKFCKEGLISMNQLNNQFYVVQGNQDLQGETADGDPAFDYNFTTMSPVLTKLNQYGDKNSEYSIKDFGSNIQTGITNGMNHPDMVVNNSTNVSGVKVSINRGADQSFKGYKIDINSGRSASEPADSKASMDFKDSIDNASHVGDWNPAGQVIKKTAGFFCEMIDTFAPLCQVANHTNTNGFTVNYEEGGGVWSIGLTRFLDITLPTYRGQAPSYYPRSPFNGTYYDWVAKSEYQASTNKYFLRLYHTIVDSAVLSDPPEASEYRLKMIEFEYWNVGPSSASLTGPIETFDDDGDYDDDVVTRVSFSIANEKVKVRVFSEDGSEDYTLADGSQAVKQHNLKPTGAFTHYLYPKISISGDGKEMEILDMRHSQPKNPVFIYGQNRTSIAQQQGLVPQHYDFYCKLKLQGIEDGYDEGPAYVDTRYMFDYGPSASSEGPTGNGSYTQIGLSASGTLNASEADGDGLGVVIIQRPSYEEGAEYDDTTGDIIGIADDIGYFGQFASVGNTFGFNDEPLLRIATSQTEFVQTYTSTSVPNMVSNNSLFIRLNNFTLTTLNGQTNGISKILYHVPRFTNTGSEFGGLFFEPTERTYVSLRNPNSIKINELNLSIVNPDETLAKTITGKTIIMLHIRKAK